MKSSEELLREGDKLAETGNLLQAIEYYRKSISVNRKNYLAYYNKGVAHMELSQYKKAAEEFAYYLIKKENDVDAWLNLAVCFINIRKFEDAISALYSALEINKNDPDIYFNLGIAYHNKGKFEDAREAFEKAVEINPTNPEYRYNLANLLADLDDYIGAEEIYRELLEEDLKELRADVLYNLGNTLIDLDDVEGAIDCYKKSIEQGGDSRAKFNLAFALENKEPDQAIILYNELISNNPEFHQAHYNLACLLARQGKPSSIHHLKECIKIAEHEYIASIKRDSDLDKIRHMSEFKELFLHRKDTES